MFARTAALYDLFYDWKDYGAEAEHIRGIVASRVPDAGSLLDVACGTGRHLEHFGRWYRIEGVDLDEGLLEIARERLPGVPLHEADMVDMDLGAAFDVVTCLFSSIGYVRTVDNLRRAVRSMAGHVAPSGVLIVEPWLTPSAFDPEHIARMMLVEGTDFQAVRTNGSRVVGTESVLEFHYLVARPGLVEHLVETHALGLFTDDENRAAFEAAGLVVEYDPVGPMGRGLWIGTRP